MIRITTGSPSSFPYKGKPHENSSRLPNSDLPQSVDPTRTHPHTQSKRLTHVIEATMAYHSRDLV
jgi:hypothetical protein